MNLARRGSSVGWTCLAVLTPAEALLAASSPNVVRNAWLHRVSRWAVSAGHSGETGSETESAFPFRQKNADAKISAGTQKGCSAAVPQQVWQLVEVQQPPLPRGRLGDHAGT